MDHYSICLVTRSFLTLAHEPSLAWCPLVPPKNVLVLWTDQQCADASGARDTPGIRTPNLDRLANTGALFQSAYCAQPVCSPARAALPTGLYAHTHGIMRSSRSLDRGLHRK